MSDPQMVVLHLSTGHVLAAAATGSVVPTVEALTGGSGLPVRLPDEKGVVTVPPDLLTATPATRDSDVLTRPTSYAVGAGVPPVTFGGDLVTLGSASAAAQGAECVSLWQTADDVEVVLETLDNTGIPKAPGPAGVTLRLVARKGAALAYEA